MNDGDAWSVNAAARPKGRFSSGRRYTRCMSGQKGGNEPPRTTSRLGGVRRRIAAFALVAALILGPAGLVAAGGPFAALTVTPSGRQQYDITTGVTLLPDGGTITDQSTGVELMADEIEYLPGEFVKATDAQVDGDFGVVRAATLEIDLESGVLRANGSLALEREGLSIRAATLLYDANRHVAVFGGGVRSEGPNFEADRLFLDVLSGDALLDGRYEYEDVLFTMRSPEAGGQLELRFGLRDGEPVYDAATEVSPELLSRFAGLL